MEPAPEQHVPEILLFKNRLQEHAQRASLPLPLYETVNEGPPHAPRFRSTVTVNGIRYRSVHTFHHRKEAEQDAARIALENIPSEVKLEGFPQIFKETLFCKSIVNEFAAKRKLPLPRYNTTQLGGIIPAFTSFLSFDGKTFTGRHGRNKKEAEQLAARAAIQSIIGDSSYGMAMLEILHSKAKMYPALKFDGPISNERRETPVTSIANAPNTENVVPMALPCVTQVEVQAEQGSVPTANQPIESVQVETIDRENGNPRANTSQYENHVAHVQIASSSRSSSVPAVADTDTVVPMALPTVVPLTLPCVTQAEQGSAPTANQPIGSVQVETIDRENGNPKANSSQYENHVAQIASSSRNSSVPVVANVVFKKRRKLKKKSS